MILTALTVPEGHTLGVETDVLTSGVLFTGGEMSDEVHARLSLGWSTAATLVAEYLSRLYRHSQELMGGRRYGDEFRSPLWEFTRYARAHDLPEGVREVAKGAEP